MSYYLEAGTYSKPVISVHACMQLQLDNTQTDDAILNMIMKELVLFGESMKVGLRLAYSMFALSVFNLSSYYEVFSFGCSRISTTKRYNRNRLWYNICQCKRSMPISES